ncbi:MAG TPA: HAD family acid phosphatase [Thermoanaerobaculia bacterium]|nr:HAD family acid phosphatase [Thermoanaerobaculia bacterium]
MIQRLLAAMFAVSLLGSCVVVTESEPATPAKPAPAAAASTHENLHVVLWMQTAAELDALSRQTFVLAGRLLAEGLADPSWTATPHVAAETEGTPAIVADVDETLLSNAAQEARLILSGESFTPETWKEWVDEAKAPPMPGAVAFTRDAARRGVTVFYVTNRRADEEAATRENLRRLGFPLRDDLDTILTRGERPEWGSDKMSRIAHVARDHRVLLLLGDNLGDFLPDVETTLEARAAMIERWDAMWGARWIVLPNPAYGSWLASLLGNERGLSRDEELRRKLEALDTLE